MNLFSDSTSTCSDCVYCMFIEDKQTEEEIYYCTELNQEIPEGTDYGYDIDCQDYLQKKETKKINAVAGDGGRKAVSSGKSTEHIIGCLLEEKQYQVKYQYKLPIKGIWNNKITVDIFCQNIPLFQNGLIIESKWQASNGTAYQKIPYEIINIKEKYPCETILIIDGDFMKYGTGLKAFEWAKQQAQGNLIAVHSLESFISWVVTKL